jgi:endonuclease III
VQRAIPRNVYEVARLLEPRYGNFNHYNRKNPLDELLFILCSTKTSESGYLETFRALRRRFRSNHQLAAASVSDIAKSIQLGGLANKKARAIKAIMREISRARIMQEG